jgi:hypothetical protein
VLLQNCKRSMYSRGDGVTGLLVPGTQSKSCAASLYIRRSSTRILNEMKIGVGGLCK